MKTLYLLHLLHIRPLYGSHSLATGEGGPHPGRYGAEQEGTVEPKLNYDFHIFRSSQSSEVDFPSYVGWLSLCEGNGARLELQYTFRQVKQSDFIADDLELCFLVLYKSSMTSTQNYVTVFESRGNYGNGVVCSIWVYKDCDGYAYRTVTGISGPYKEWKTSVWMKTGKKLSSL